MKNANNFNALRLFAAILVVITHSYAITGNVNSEPLFWITNGNILCASVGLYIFFFISGYLVTKSAQDAEDISHFFIKRFLRIYPALIVLVLVSVFLVGPVLTRFSLKEYFESGDTWKYLWTLTGLRIRMFLPGIFDTNKFNGHGFNGSLWTIALELKLYISLGIISVLAKRIHKRLNIYISFFVIAFCLVLMLTNDYLKQKGIMISNKGMYLVIIFYLLISIHFFSIKDRRASKHANYFR
jgi:peptidoglycan/LPS O-acetylase OafA/YrhL